MSIITKVLKQNAVYWGPSVEDGDGGFVTPSPVEIACRWDAVEEVVKGPRTHDRLSNSVVMVDRDVEVNGYLYLGTRDGIEQEFRSNPETFEPAKRISGFKKTPNFKATEFYREAHL